MIGRGIQLGAIFGIPIRVHYSWAFIVALVTLSMSYRFGQTFPYLGLPSRLGLGLSASLLLFGSVLAHELSHAVVALGHQVGIRGITLFIFGGAAEMIDEPPSAVAELRIAIAGPLMSVALGVVCGGLYYAGLGTVPLPFVDLVSWLALANGMIAVFNLLPGFPLDGGRVLRATLWGIWGKLAAATRVAASVGSFLGLVVIALGFVWIFGYGNLIGGLWFVLIGFFLRSAARASYQQLLLRRSLEGVRARDLVTPGVATARPGMTLAEIVDDVVLPKGVSEVAVVDDGRLVGMIRIPDIRSREKEDWTRLTAFEVMSRDALADAVLADEDAFRVLALLGSDDRALPVIEHGMFLGLVTRADLARRIQLRVESTG